MSLGGQQKSDTSLYLRLLSLKKARQWTWGQVGNAVDLSVPAIMMIKSGRRGMSANAESRLESAEAEAGIAAPLSQPPPAPSALHDPGRSSHQLTVEEQALLDDLRGMNAAVRDALFPWIRGLIHAAATLPGETHAALGGRDRQTGGLTGSGAALPEQRISTTESLPGVEPTVAKVAREGAVRAARIRRKAADQ